MRTDPNPTTQNAERYEKKKESNNTLYCIYFLKYSIVLLSYKNN